MDYKIEMDVIDEIPDLPVGRVGQWTDAVAAAAEDGKARAVKGIPADAMDKVRRQLSHTAGALKTEKYPQGAGVVTRVKDGVLYWQVAGKRVRSAPSGTSGPGGASGNGGTPTPAQGATKKAAAARS